MPSKKIDNEENKKKINLSKKSIIIIIITFILTIIAGTFAWLTWKSNETALVLTVGDIDDVQVVLKPYQINTEVSPVLSYDGEEYVSVTATNNGKSSKMVKLFYQISNIDTELVSTDFKYTITKSTDNGVTYTEYLSGNFSTASSTSNFNIMEDRIQSNTIYKYRIYIWLDGNNIQSDIQGKSFKAELRAEITEAPPITATALINKANPSTLTYADATDIQKGEMWTFFHDATEQTSALKDYRYIGNTPNNYITFNNETWRIIGVFDGKIKIIRNDSIGSMPWDYKKSGVGSSPGPSGSSDWADSQLMYMLNPTSYKLKDGYTLDGYYIKDASGNIIYQLGCLPTSIESGDTLYSCTENTWSLNETALSQINEVTYYLGGGSYDSTAHYGTTEEIYTWERGTKTFKNTRPINWQGLVGLMYPSDYGYTFANGVDETCYTDAYSCVTQKGGTPRSSWLFKLGLTSWTVSVYSSYAFSAFAVTSIGDVRDYSVDSSFGVRPVVYLRSDIQLSGSGTSTSPYEIVE